MIETFIEIWSKTVVQDGERHVRGDPDLTAYKQLRDNAAQFRAVAHHNIQVDTKGVPSTLFHVVADPADVGQMIAAHPDHSNFGINKAAYRGLWLQPGTPTNSAVNDLQSRIGSGVGEDIGTIVARVSDASDHPSSTSSGPQSFKDFLKHDRPDLSPGDDGYRPPFDPTAWLVGSDPVVKVAIGEQFVGGVESASVQ